MFTLQDIRDKGQQFKRNKSFALMTGYTIHREISLYLTWFILKIFPKARPELVSSLMIIVGLVGILAIFSQDLVLNLAGFGLVYLSFLLDKVDGEISRLREVYNVEGVYLDELYHVLIQSGLVVATFYTLVVSSLISPLLLLLVVWLTLFNRHNRKTPLLLYLKLRGRVEHNELTRAEPTLINRFITKLMNSYLFKIASVLERFDLVLLSFAAAYVLDVTFMSHAILYTFYGYALLAVLGAIRWSCLYALGRAHTEIERIHKEGY